MGAADEAIAFATAQLGKPYKWATAGPNTYDCSGLVFASYRAGGIKIGRTTFTMINYGTHVAKADLLPGDIVFPEPTHVQLYVGNGYVIEAPHRGSFVRKVKMWGFWQARRVAAPATDTSLSVTTTALNLPPIVPNPLDFLPGIGPIIALWGNNAFWKRAGMFLLGAIVVLAAFAFLNRAKLESAAKTAAKVGEVAAIA